MGRGVALTRTPSQLEKIDIITAAISNLNTVQDRVPRAAVARAMFAMMAPVIRLLVCGDFASTPGFSYEDFEPPGSEASLLNDKDWGLTILSVGKRLLELIDDATGVQDGGKVVGAVEEDRVVEVRMTTSLHTQSYISNSPLRSSARTSQELTKNFVENVTNTNSLMLHTSFVIAATFMLEGKSETDDEVAVTLQDVFLLTPEDLVMDSGDFFSSNSLCLEPHRDGRQNRKGERGASVANLTERQKVFLNKAIRDSPESLGTLYELGAAWGSTKGVVNTIYVTAMWWTGKDGEVEDLVTTGLSGGIDAEVLVSEGVRVSCWRIQKLIDGFRKEKTLKAILGTLDADTTMYVKDVAAQIETGGFKERK